MQKYAMVVERIFELKSQSTFPFFEYKKTTKFNQTCQNLKLRLSSLSNISINVIDNYREYQ